MHVGAYPARFQYLIGVAETAAGAGLPMKRTRLAAAAMTGVMFGAILTALRAGQTGDVVVPLIALRLTVFVARTSQ